MALLNKPMKEKKVGLHLPMLTHIMVRVDSGVELKKNQHVTFRIASVCWSMDGNSKYTKKMEMSQMVSKMVLVGIREFEESETERLQKVVDNVAAVRFRYQLNWDFKKKKVIIYLWETDGRRSDIRPLRIKRTN
jgi:hypothetical protein